MLEQRIAERVRSLAEAFRDGGLVRLAVRDAEFELELKRAAREHAVASDLPSERTPRATEAVVADVVGTVRFLHPAVVEGQPIDADRDLAFVETLGVRNAVRSGGPGRVAAVYVEDGQPVEYGQPLFAIER